MYYLVTSINFINDNFNELSRLPYTALLKNLNSELFLSYMSTFEDAVMSENKKGEEGYEAVTPRQVQQRGIILIPQPSNDPRDPLVTPLFW